MTESESLLAKQIRNMSGIRSDQPIQPLTFDEQVVASVPTGGRLIYSGLIEQTGTGLPIVYAASEYNPLSLTKNHTRESAGYYKMKFFGTQLQSMNHDLRRVAAFAQSSHLTHIVSLCVSPYWESNDGVYNLQLWVTNWRHNHSVPALMDELRFNLEIKVF